VDARPLLERVARALEAVRLDAVLIGNAGAALQGAPVTTLDLDFMFRATPSNLRKLKALARALDAVVLRPYYPASELFRVVNDDLGLQADFMGQVDGVRSFERLRARATPLSLGGASLRVAALADIVRSKRAANRPRDRAVLPVLEATLREQARRA
jgi:NAD(P)-dependent dehydrogenase (short-subunit alcohol dehydrogenase family)